MAQRGTKHAAGGLLVGSLERLPAPPLTPMFICRWWDNGCWYEGTVVRVTRGVAMNLEQGDNPNAYYCLVE